MANFIATLKTKIAANPFLSLLASAGVTYLTMHYGPAISVVQSLVCPGK
jgi:hypothetical protein